MGVAERKERDRLARRRDILSAARECFFKNGYENTTIQQIAERVELSTGTLYLYFGSKEEIYISILEEGLDILVALLRDAARPNVSGVDNIRNLVDAFLHFQNDYGEYLEIMAFMRFSSDRGTRLPEDLQQRVQERTDKAYAIVGGVLQQGIDSGELRPVDTRNLTRVFWSLLTGLVLLHERGADDSAMPSLEQLVELGVSLILDGVRLSSSQPATTS